MTGVDPSIFKDGMSDAQKLSAYRYECLKQKHFNYCEFQEVVNLMGGDQYSPAFTDHPRSPHDNISQYGFKEWSHYATFSVLDDELKMPTFSGVYAVTSVYNRFDANGLTIGALHLLYIGSAKNIAARMEDKDHWYNRALEREGREVSVHLWVLPTTDYRLYEKCLIRTLRPLFNIHHRNG